MKSSSGAYYVGLDHVRALAVLVVWTWHFIQIHEIQAVPAFPLSFLAEGHSGVAIFMTLSGYLFARLLAGKRIDYAAFITNRVIRLAPLLVFVLLVVGLKKVYNGESVTAYIQALAEGLVLPTLPNGGWSITVEFHFYLLLPLLLLLQSRSQYALIWVLLGAVILRVVLFQHADNFNYLRVSQYEHVGSMQHYLSFFTIVGRIDQFLLGMLACRYRSLLQGRHLLAIAVAAAFLLFQSYFDTIGGYDTTITSFWIYLPTIEGLTFGLLIAWYDTSFKHSKGSVSQIIANVGTYSYSIYLLHIFVVWEISTQIHKHICDLSNIYVALFFALITFPIVYPIGSVFYRLIELPFLSYRKQYVLDQTRKTPPAQSMLGGIAKTLSKMIAEIRPNKNPAA